VHDEIGSASTQGTKQDGLMILLILFVSLLFPVAVMSSDTGLVCAIDMGSTNFKLMLGEMKGGAYVQHHYMKDRLAVGNDMVKTGVISSAKLKEIRRKLEAYLAVCDSKGVLARSAVATAAFREAKNQAVVKEIAKSLNLPLDIASEKRESQLAYLVGTLGKRNFAVLDNGSRSIELVTYGEQGYQWSVFNLGYGIAYDRFFQPAKTFAEANDNYRQVLAPYFISATFMKNRDGFVGVEMEHAVRHLLSLERADGVSISQDTVSRKVAALRAMSETDFTQLKKVKNIEALLPRIVVLDQSMSTFGYREMQVFERELGVGLIVEKGVELK